MSDQEREGRRHSRRMQFVSAQQDSIGMTLRQMGASVQEIHGLVCFVRFDLGGTELFYVYNLNADDQYYLQRVKPYPMSAGVFADSAAIAAYIERDVNAFRGAAQSGQFELFVDASRRLAALTQTLEEAFMSCNVPKPAFDRIGNALDAMEGILAEIRQSADPLRQKP